MVEHFTHYKKLNLFIIQQKIAFQLTENVKSITL